MHKIKIRLPATLTNLGPGLRSLGLALSLYTTVEISARDDEQLLVETIGEGAGSYSIGLHHPVVLALIHMFQRLERAPLGIAIKIDNHIPINSGLGAETAFIVAGVIAANNLMSNVFPREELLKLSAQISHRPDGALTAMLGGLTASVVTDDSLIYRSLPVTSMQVIVALPELVDFPSPSLPERVSLEDAAFNLARVPLLADALRDADVSLLAQVMDDKLHVAHVTEHITGYGHVVEMARRAGAKAITPSGDGPALVFFAEEDHDAIAEAVTTAFENFDVNVRTWILPLDTQGVVISLAQSA
jgi:homoserine kinase